MKTEITKELVEIICKVNSFFDDHDKTWLWMRTKNLNFGDIAPIDLINRGRWHKLLEFINDALDANKPNCQPWDAPEWKKDTEWILSEHKAYVVKFFTDLMIEHNLKKDNKPEGEL